MFIHILNRDRTLVRKLALQLQNKLPFIFFYVFVCRQATLMVMSNPMSVRP